VRFPHTGYWKQAQANASGNVQTATTRDGRGVRIRCQATPLDAATAFDKTGNGELRNPFELFLPFAQGTLMQAGDDITLDNHPGKVFRISTKPVPWDAIRRIRYVHAVVEQLDHTEA